MRIVGGNLKGRTIKAPPGRDVRPTSDRAREALFNVLLNGRHAISMDGVIVLDVFAGTGALGLEALSRGASHAVFLDNNRASLACIKENAATFGVSDDVSLVNTDARVVGRPPPVLTSGADLVFLDPPYRQDLVVSSVARLESEGWIDAQATVIIETESSIGGPEITGFDVLDSRVYGAARITFLRHA